jgi:hypothetical protein
MAHDLSLSPPSPAPVFLPQLFQARNILAILKTTATILRHDHKQISFRGTHGKPVWNT